VTPPEPSSPGISATATWRGGYATDVDVRGHTLRVDEPAHVGGDDTGPMPTELMCAALSGCFVLALAHVAGKRDRDLPGLRVTVRAERAGTELRYGRFVVEASADVPRDELEGLLERAVRFCWVSNTLARPPEVEYRVS
jgi:putative redox protein